MRPIPAARLGDSHGLLRAVAAGNRVRVDALTGSTRVGELFRPGLQNALAQVRLFVAYARAAGLLNEDRGTAEVTEMGRRYLRAADPAHFFDVSPAQAEWLQRLLRERHMSDTIYHGAAIALSLFASNPPDFRPSTTDVGRALSHLGRAGWDSAGTFQSQGTRYTALLQDMRLLDAARLLTPAGVDVRRELTLPGHVSLRDLAAQLNPGGLEAAIEEGYAEWVAAPAAAPAAPQPPPAAAPQPAGASPPPPAPAPAAAAGGYETFGAPAAPDAGGAPSPPAPPGAAPPPPPGHGAPPPAPPPPAYAPPGAAPPAPDPGLPPSLADAAGAATRGTAVPSPPAPQPAPAAPPPAPARAPRGAATVPPAALAAAARARGLRLPGTLHSAVAAALSTGRHLLLTGPPASGKTTLALAVAEVAVAEGHAGGVTLLPGAIADAGAIVAAAHASRWVVLDELDALPDGLGAFLAGHPATFRGGEAAAPPAWRVVATAEQAPRRLRGFAVVAVPPASAAELAQALVEAAGGDTTAAEAVRRLLPVRDLAPVGTGAFLDAARYAASRNALSPTDEATLAREALDACVAPLLGAVDPAALARLAGR